MALLILGLVVFLGAHSIQIFAGATRAGAIARLGPGRWKGLYSLVSLAGFVLIIVGYGQARASPPLYAAPGGMAPLTFLLVTVGFICLVAAYWPANHIKRLVGDPMVLGVGLWAAGHLLVLSSPAAVTLFGAFLVWAVAEFISLRVRARASPPIATTAKALNTVFVVVVGLLLAGAFIMGLHKLLIGVSPMAAN